jgi:hypothetical protein
MKTETLQKKLNLVENTRSLLLSGSFEGRYAMLLVSAADWLEDMRQDLASKLEAKQAEIASAAPEAK